MRCRKKNIVYCEMGTRKLSLEVFYPTQKVKKNEQPFLLFMAVAGDREIAHSIIRWRKGWLILDLYV
jgi:hypothetical protein